jgi:hypothetical protein
MEALEVMETECAGVPEQRTEVTEETMEVMESGTELEMGLETEPEQGFP